MLTADVSSLMETGYSLLMDSHSAINAKKLLASTDFQIHVQPIIGFTSESSEPRAATVVIFSCFLLTFSMKPNWFAKCAELTQCVFVIHTNR